MPCMPGADWMWPGVGPKGKNKAMRGTSGRPALIMDLSRDHCKAGMFGLYCLVQDVLPSLAAMGGLFLWQISLETNLLTAFIFGIIGTVGFAIFGRDLPEPTNKEEVQNG